MDAFAEQTKYLDEALHADARHETVSPPLLSAAIRNRMLRALLAIAPGDRVIDLGCGSGRTLVWNRDCGARAVGVDVSPYFAAEARTSIDLTLGDLRRLPFADGAFSKACSLDVLEHLSREALDSVLAEASRVLAPGGALFVYSHVRKNSRLALGVRYINQLAGLLESCGLVDMTQERLRKSDHVNPLEDLADLRQAVQRAGFRIARIEFYTPIVGALVENILVRVAERMLARRAARRLSQHRDPEANGLRVGSGSSMQAAALRAARIEAKRRIAARGPAYAVLRGLTWLMRLDVWLLGRVPSGPFFALLVKVGPSVDARRLAGDGASTRHEMGERVAARA